MLGSASAESYRRVLPVVQADEDVDAVIALFVPAATVSAEDVWGVLRDADETEKPVLPVILASETPSGSFPYPETAARALGRAAERAGWLRRPAGVVPDLEGVDRQVADETVAQALARGEETWLTASETRALLEAYRVPLVDEELTSDPASAGVAAAKLGFPIVVKSAEPGAHKTESGGVALNLMTASDVREAAARIGGAVLVQPMISGGAELLAGVVQDPVFGPLVAFGPGGVFAELIGEAAFRIAPLTDQDVDELIQSGKTGQLVNGFRGRPPSDALAFADLLHRLSRLADELHSVAELDLNPVIGLRSGCVAVDARVRVARTEASRRTKTW
jgi:acetate---CoA ligase (ADP-forming)